MSTLNELNIRRPRTTSPNPLTVRQVATAYNFPLGQATGKGYTAGIIELGGGYDPAQLGQIFTEQGIPQPARVIDVNVGSGTNGGPHDPNGADGEVQSDIEVFASVAHDATIRVYFSDQSNESFLAAVKQALAECDGVSLSWGASENTWDAPTMAAFEAVIAEARTRKVPLFVAAGDTGSGDSSGAGNQVDFPASAPSAIGCGGTRLTLNPDGTRAAEVVWNDDPNTSATGGGVSIAFPGRQVPDIAGNADPDTGYVVSVDGSDSVIGGTSLVAPLMLGLHALLWQQHGAFDFVNVVATHANVCFEVTIGNNGAYRAGPGRNDVTGYGVPDGAAMSAVLATLAVAPAPGPTQPVPAPPGAPPGPAPQPAPAPPIPALPVGLCPGAHDLISHSRNLLDDLRALLDMLDDMQQKLAG